MKLSEFDFTNAKIMISFPMRGKTDDECRSDYRALVSKIMNAAEGTNAKIINTYFGDNPECASSDNTAINYLARSIKAMSHANAVYFARDWDKARGCRIEHMIASEYGLTILTD